MSTLNSPHAYKYSTNVCMHTERLDLDGMQLLVDLLQKTSPLLKGISDNNEHIGYVLLEDISQRVSIFKPIKFILYGNVDISGYGKKEFFKTLNTCPYVLVTIHFDHITIESESVWCQKNGYEELYWLTKALKLELHKKTEDHNRKSNAIVCLMNAMDRCSNLLWNYMQCR